MRSRATFLALFIIIGSFALPHLAHAGGIPFFGPIIPKDYSICPAGWGLLITVVNNIISLLLTLMITFVAPLMIAYAGFLLVVNRGDSGAISKARGIFTNIVVGLVVSFSAWMIVDWIMAALYSPSDVGGTWSSLISGGGDACLPQKGALPGEGLTSAGSTGVATSPGTGACAVTPLTPLATALAQRMESGQTIIWDNTDSRLKPCVDKFIGQVGGTVTSAYRPAEYQSHLREIYDKWCGQGLKTNTQVACTSIKSAISTEVGKHFGSSWSCGSVGQTSQHSSGTAVDISGINHSSAAVQQAAASSCLTWRNYPGDPYHYDLKSSCSCR